MPHRNLSSFTRWFMQQRLVDLRPPHGQLSFYMLATNPYDSSAGNPVAGCVLHRDEEYQVELFMFLPTEHGSEFPPHRHPNVDSIEYFLTGPIAFNINGARVASDAKVYGVNDDGSSSMCGNYLRVRHTAAHGAKVGKEGGAFLSIQRWRNGVHPSSVGLDWDGPSHVATAGVSANG